MWIDLLMGLCYIIAGFLHIICAYSGKLSGKLRIFLVIFTVGIVGKNICFEVCS